MKHAVAFVIFLFSLVPDEPPHLQCAKMHVVECELNLHPCNSAFLWPNGNTMCYKEPRVDICKVSYHAANILSVSLSDVLVQNIYVFSLRVILVVE